MPLPTIQRPKLPARLYQPHPGWSVAFIVYSLAVFFGPGMLAGHLAVAKDVDLHWKLLAIPVLLLIAQQGVTLMGFVGHEGIHLSLFSNRLVSAIVGISVSGASLFSAVGFGILHWNHHRFTNQPQDPDPEIFSRFHSLWRRLFFARSFATRQQLRALFAMARGRELPVGYKLPFSAAVRRRLALFNVAVLLAWSSFYAYFLFRDPVRALFSIVLPLILGIFTSGLRAYIEHTGTGVGLFDSARSYTSPIYTILFAGNNYHLEHHIYPSVPCYYLPAVHRVLRSSVDRACWAPFVDGSALGPLGHAASDKQYPRPQHVGDTEDPFALEHERAA